MSATIERPGSFQQHEALRRANWVKHKRAAFKAELRMMGQREGAATLADAILEVPEWLEGADTRTILTWPWGLGARSQSPVAEHRADRLYAATGCRQWHRLAELSPRQREVLASRLRQLAGVVSD